MTSCLQCPICNDALVSYKSSRDLHCRNHHQFSFCEVHEGRGYWQMVKAKAKSKQQLSRAQLRAQRFLLANGLQVPLLEAMQQLLLPQLDSVQSLVWLDYESGDGFYLRALTQLLNTRRPDLTLQRHGFAEAGNALFAAVKAGCDETFIQCSSKRLPYADHCIDLLTLIDKPLKGKEAVRVLKHGGLALMVIPASRHLWQLRSQVLTNLVEKDVNIQLPNELQLIASTELAYAVDVDGQQALTLLDMTPYAWRASDKLKTKISRQAINGLELNYRLVIARRV